ncbi:FAD-dependent oxidoreductase [Acinetobacter portensis]|uniref:FAD-dependent oxidoreductase n=1 Tax=Acinetobacter portensis TaxID=1839785 RepID=A0ABY4K0B7_9GAMM|nr:bifunctional TVP38/TMEM64 family protein/FAD-dependent oxidoreductase [Acinetobacter portensis]MCK7609871.1 FAD-dependent oxidoreductase [Acinetobacter portensis]MCK7640646.1 FAD-dependent oxidoreductase [Acinetobacter portensis]UPO24827.1 FAD-dependent oxidoreductase [Acinetobacter portensis]
MKKMIIIAVIISAIFAFFAFNGQQYFNLEYIQSQLQLFHSWRDENPILSASIFFLIYVLVAALSLPGAAVMTLLAGALFGILWGTILVSFASSIGALFAFLIARFVLRDYIEQRFPSYLKKINKGIEKDGAMYLFTLRLVPVIAFFIINLVMGITRIKARTFYIVSQIGMLAGTIVYVNAGTQLAKIEDLSDIVSLPILLSFALLATFPWIIKIILSIFQKRKIYQKWSKPKHFDRNLIVIGAGAAGLVSSYIAATVKAKVTLVEAHKMGGDCLNYGCVPSKALISCAKTVKTIKDAEINDISCSKFSVNFKAVMNRVHQAIKKIEPHDSIDRYTQLGVDVKTGYATIISPWEVEIKDEKGIVERLTTRSIIIATGAHPFVPPLSGLEDVGYLTSDTLWDKFSTYEQAPSRLIVLGGGPIGCELSQAFSRLGSTVFQIEMSNLILSREDSEVSQYIKQNLEQDGVQVLTQHKAIRCECKNGVKQLWVEHQNQEYAIEFDEIIVAVGRSARLTGYGLEQLGIETQRTVITNDYLETLYPNIFAAGDVAGPYQFTHTAAHQAWYATVNALFGTFKKFKTDYRVIPWITFVDPEVARVGLNEQEAKEKNIPYEVTTYGIDDLDRAITDGHDAGWIKVLTVPNKDKILGVTIVGYHGGELLAEFVLAMKHGLGLNKILGTIHPYPTLNEANKYVAGEWKRAHAPQKLLKLAERYHAWRRK